MRNRTSFLDKVYYITVGVLFLTGTYLGLSLEYKKRELTRWCEESCLKTRSQIFEKDCYCQTDTGDWVRLKAGKSR